MKIIRTKILSNHKILIPSFVTISKYFQLIFQNGLESELYPIDFIQFQSILKAIKHIVLLTIFCEKCNKDHTGQQN